MTKDTKKTELSKTATASVAPAAHGKPHTSETEQQKATRKAAIRARRATHMNAPHGTAAHSAPLTK